MQGVVKLYEITNGNSLDENGLVLQIEESHTLALTKPGDKNTPIKLSAVTSLAWSSDGFALSVGWVFGGFSVWSIFGCLLTSTISEDTFVHSLDGIVTDTDEVFFTGVQELFWSPGDHYLFVLPAATFEKETVLDIYVIEFAKSSILSSISDVSSRSVCLISSDRLMIYDGINIEGSTIGMDPLNWSTVNIPPIYLNANWPIKFAVGTSNGQYIVVAGTHGLAHYNAASEKWKLFGNEQQEQSFQVTALLWYRNLIIAACKNVGTNASEIRIFSREARLDESNILHTEKLEHPATAMNLTDNNLLVYCQNCVLRSYFVITSNGPRITLQLKQAFSLEGFVGIGGVQAISRFPIQPTATLSDCPVLLLKSGTLHMIWKNVYVFN